MFGAHSVMWGVCVMCSLTLSGLKLFAWGMLIGGLLAIDAGADVIVGNTGSRGCPIVDFLLVFSQELMGLAGLWTGLDSLSLI